MNRPESPKVKDVRAFLNRLAVEIRTMKGKRKGEPNGHVAGLTTNRITFRVWHLAQSLARGRRWEQIEAPKFVDGVRVKSNDLSEENLAMVKRIAKEIKAQREEDDRIWEARIAEQRATMCSDCVDFPKFAANEKCKGFVQATEGSASKCYNHREGALV